MVMSGSLFDHVLKALDGLRFPNGFGKWAVSASTLSLRGIHDFYSDVCPSRTYFSCTHYEGFMERNYRGSS